MFNLNRLADAPDLGGLVCKVAPLTRTANEAFVGSPVSPVRKVTILQSPDVVKQGIMDTEEPLHEIAGDPKVDNPVAVHMEDTYIPNFSHGSTPEAFTSPEADVKAWWHDSIARNMNVSDYYTHVASCSSSGPMSWTIFEHAMK